jgi:hypothetical protein
MLDALLDVLLDALLFARQLRMSQIAAQRRLDLLPWAALRPCKPPCSGGLSGRNLDRCSTWTLRRRIAPTSDQSAHNEAAGWLPYRQTSTPYELPLVRRTRKRKHCSNASMTSIGQCQA